MKLNRILSETYTELTSNRGWILFILFCLIQWLFIFVNTEFVSTDYLFDEYIESKRQEKYDNYDELAAEFEDDIEDFEDEEEYYWSDQAWDMGILLILSLLKFSIISMFLFVGLTLRSETEGVLFKPIFKVVIVSEAIFFIPTLIKLVWFLFIDQNYDYLEIRNFNPWSLLSIFGSENVADWLIYPLKTINLFEAFYVYLLVVGVSAISKIEISKIAKPVIASYGLMLTLWISLRIYLSTLF